MRHLHRLIVTSAAYRRASHAAPDDAAWRVHSAQALGTEITALSRISESA